MCLWAWMMAFTSSELTMLSILLQKTPDAVGSSMAGIKTGKLKTNCNDGGDQVFGCLENTRTCSSVFIVVLHPAPHCNLHKPASYDRARLVLNADSSCSVRKPVQLETSKDWTPQKDIVWSVRMIQNRFDNRANQRLSTLSYKQHELMSVFSLRFWSC